MNTSKIRPYIRPTIRVLSVTNSDLICGSNSLDMPNNNAWNTGNQTTTDYNNNNAWDQYEGIGDYKNNSAW